MSWEEKTSVRCK